MAYGWTYGAIAVIALAILAVYLFLTHGSIPALGAVLIAVGVLVAYLRHPLAIFAAIAFYVVGGILVYLAFVPVSGVVGY